VTPRKRVSREKGPLPGRGGNNLPKNSIIGPLISRLRRRDQAALCQGRVRSGERTRLHSGAPARRPRRPGATSPEIEPRRNVEDSLRRFWDIVDIERFL